jgi:tetratricopeptide (TPR) repeat protein
MRVVLGVSLWAMLTAVPLAAAPLPSPAAVQPALPAIQQHGAEQWDNALDDWIVHLKGVHPDAFAKTGRLAWLRAADAFRRDLPRLTEEQRMVRMMQLNGLIGDGHTFLEPDRPDFGMWYPVHIVQFPDGYFVTSAHQSVKDLAGAEVLEIAGRPIGEAAAAAKSLIGADNEFGARFNLGSLHNAALMRGLGFATPSFGLPVKFKLASGKIATVTLAPVVANDRRYSPGFSRNDWEDSSETLGPPIGSPAEWITAFNGEPATAFRVRDERHPVQLTLRRGLVTRDLPQQHAYYIQSNIVEDNFDESFRHLFRRAMSEIDAAKPKNIILDLRYNPGGDGSRVSELIPMFARHIGPQQNLFVLTGAKTFSAAIDWLRDFNEFLHPSIVGEPAGASLNSFGDPHEYPLPVIGVTTRLSTVRHGSTPNDLSRYTPVDVPAPMTFADWKSGRDPAVDPILQGKEMRSFAQIALTDGAEAARKAFAERADLFTKYPWWSPPPEIELRRAIQLLTEDGRYEDAIAIGEIATKFHPEVWNSWYNLGQPQLAASRLVEAQVNMRKVLEVDPNNFNKAELAAIAKRGAETEFTVPSILQWGGTVAAIEALAKEQCDSSRTRPINPPFLEAVKKQQQQIDCEGFEYQGAKRHLELIIRDGELVGAWLMMRADEQARVIAWMKRDLDEPAIEQSNYVVYPKHMLAWRKDKAELLFYSPALAEEARSWFANPGN